VHHAARVVDLHHDLAFARRILSATPYQNINNFARSDEVLRETADGESVGHVNNVQEHSLCVR
jgi:hypothetical protein